MVVTDNTLCPHCARPPADGGGATDDHIFSKFFGGRDTVIACKDCNSGVGSRVEGKLLGPESILTLLLQQSGLPHGPLKAKHPLGEFMVDLATGDHSALTSVSTVETDADGTTVRVFGSPDEVAKINAGLERKYGPLEILSQQVGSKDSEPESLDISVSSLTTLLRRLIAKTALCALTYLQGDAFVETAMADWLREVLDAPREWPEAVKRPPRPDAESEEVPEDFDPALTVARSQAWLQRLGLQPFDVDGSLGTLVIGAQPKYAAGPHTGIVMSLLGWVIPVGLFVPGVPANMVAPTFLVKRRDEPIAIFDLARGRPNGYDL